MDVPSSTQTDQDTKQGNLSEKLTQLSTAVSSGNTINETAAHNELSFATEDLIAYLNNHIYTSNSFASYGGYGPTSEDAKNDIVTRVKQDIRSVKGAVLNMYVALYWSGVCLRLAEIFLSQLSAQLVPDNPVYIFTI
jgi:hypothetical protein